MDMIHRLKTLVPLDLTRIDTHENIFARHAKELQVLQAQTTVYARVRLPLHSFEVNVDLADPGQIPSSKNACISQRHPGISSGLYLQERLSEPLDRVFPWREREIHLFRQAVSKTSAWGTKTLAFSRATRQRL